MANTEFYHQIEKDSAKITWKDVFSECRKKHTKADLEYALLAGTSLDSATEEDMLKKWRKPWVFYPLLKSALILVAMIYGLLYLSLAFFQGETIHVIVQFVPPLVMPVVVMVFIWELNIPRNISVYDLAAYFLVGGLLSLFAVMAMFQFVEGEDAALAAFREEPAKLAATLVLLYAFSRKKKVYGLTGLVIGAAVGAGFGGFESVMYAMSAGESGIWGAVSNEIIRGIFALGGHAVYCAPYAAAVALGMKDSRFTAESFLNKDFLLTFACSTGAHFVWNSGLFWEFGMIRYVLITALLWIELLYIARKCLEQAVVIGRRSQRSFRQDPTVPYFPAGSVCVERISGAGKGTRVRSYGNEPLTIGRGEDMVFCIRGRADGISRRHCSIQRTPHGWTLRDMGSTYGTFVGRGQKLSPGAEHKLRSGEVFYLAGKEHAFRIIME